MTRKCLNVSDPVFNLRSLKVAQFTNSSRCDDEWPFRLRAQAAFGSPSPPQSPQGKASFFLVIDSSHRLIAVERECEQFLRITYWIVKNPSESDVASDFAFYQSACIAHKD